MPQSQACERPRERLDRAARLSWSARKKQPRGKLLVSVQTASAKAMAFWWTWSFSKAKAVVSPFGMERIRTARE